MPTIVIGLAPSTVFVSRAVTDSLHHRQSTVSRATILAEEATGLSALSESQTGALIDAAKSSKYYTSLNKPGGASSETWASVRDAYPELEGIDDATLAAAFAQTKRVGAGNRDGTAAEDVTCFADLKPPQKVALVRAVRGGTYAAKLEAAGGVSAAAWDLIVAEASDLAGLPTATLERLTAELLDMKDAREMPPGSLRSKDQAGVAPLAALAVVALIASYGFSSGDGFDANAQVQLNLQKWKDKNLPS